MNVLFKTACKIRDAIQHDIARVREHQKPGVLQILNVWSILPKKERVLFAGLGIVTIATGLFFAVRFSQEKIVSVPDVGGTYSEGVLEEPRFINPILAVNDTERSIVNLVFQGLFRYDNSGALQPNAAESYTLSPDGTQYTVTLKQTNRWHDGTVLSADDVLFTVAMIQNPDYRSALRPNWQGVTAEKKDDWTVVFTLRQPYAPFVQNLTVGILPQHIWSAIRPEVAAQAEFNVKPIGSGPYQFSALTRSPQGTILSYTLERRKDAKPKEPPYIKTITFQTFSSEETMFSALQRGKIEGMSSVSAEKAGDIQKRAYTLYTARLPQIFALFLNPTKNKILADKNVRSAIDYAVDRRNIVETIFHGGAEAIAAPFPRGSLGFDASIAIRERDSETAKILLDKAGWTENAETGIRERITKATRTTPEKVEPLQFTLVTSQWPDLVETAQLLKTQLSEVGIGLTINIVSIPELEYQYIRLRNYDMLLFGEGFGRDPDPFAFWHSTQVRHPGLNLAMYNNNKVDALLESARRAKNQAEAEKEYREIQALIIQDVPAIFLYTPYYFFAMKNAIQGVTVENISKPSDRFYEAPGWYIHTDWKLK